MVLPQLPVIFAVDRAGAVEDGPTHHGIYDLGFLRAMPGLVILAPRCEAELLPMLEYARSLATPVAIRYPRGGTPEGMECSVAPLETGRAEILREGSASGPVLWAMGPECRTAVDVATRLKAEHGIDCTVVNARFLAPFDRELARKLAPGRLVVSIEDHVVTGGLNTVAVRMPQNEIARTLISLAGVPVCALFLLLRWVLELVLWGTIIYVLLSWLQPASPAYGMIWRLMNPILGPLSNRLPRLAGLDWSPLVIFLIVNALLYWVTPISQGYFVSAWF